MFSIATSILPFSLSTATIVRLASSILNRLRAYRTHRPVRPSAAVRIFSSVYRWFSQSSSTFPVPHGLWRRRTIASLTSRTNAIRVPIKRSPGRTPARRRARPFRAPCGCLARCEPQGRQSRSRCQLVGFKPGLVSGAAAREGDEGLPASQSSRPQVLRDALNRVSAAERDATFPYGGVATQASPRQGSHESL